MNEETAVFNHEPIIRLGIFGFLFLFISVYEVIAPRRKLDIKRSVRWSNNLAIAILNTVVLRLLFPGAAVGIAYYAESLDSSLMKFLPFPGWMDVVIAIILLDLAIYFQHRLFHAIPFTWRLHRMHHADTTFDITTGLRFHPLEIILSMLIKSLAIIVIGAPVLAVLIFELLLSSTSLFNHGNMKLPKNVDHLIRWFIVTPDMHRVHHSSTGVETDSNFGFNLPCWDRLFNTYKDQPKLGHRNMEIGLKEFRNSKELRIDQLLTQPFRSEKK